MCFLHIQNIEEGRISLKQRRKAHFRFWGKCRLSNHHKGALRAVCQDLRRARRVYYTCLRKTLLRKKYDHATTEGMCTSVWGFCALMSCRTECHCVPWPKFHSSSGWKHIKLRCSDQIRSHGREAAAPTACHRPCGRWHVCSDWPELCWPAIPGGPSRCAGTARSTGRCHFNPWIWLCYAASRCWCWCPCCWSCSTCQPCGSPCWGQELCRRNCRQQAAWLGRVPVWPASFGWDLPWEPCLVPRSWIETWPRSNARFRWFHCSWRSPPPNWAFDRS